ncbi:MAG: hypothetical protein JW772_02240 [Candidatus Diapherotrites archaeon]|nr:hypothetical protein [Candidatus Diapherotrites archaeon]
MIPTLFLFFLVFAAPLVLHVYGFKEEAMDVTQIIAGFFIGFGIAGVFL